MKYLKKFESQLDYYIDEHKDHPKPKFKVGDYVRLVNDSYPDGWQSEPYEIIGVEYKHFFTSNYQSNFGYYYLLDTENGKISRNEKNLILVPDYEMNAIKYNL